MASLCVIFPRRCGKEPIQQQMTCGHSTQKKGFAILVIEEWSLRVLIPLKASEEDESISEALASDRVQEGHYQSHHN